MLYFLPACENNSGSVCSRKVSWRGLVNVRVRGKKNMAHGVCSVKPLHVSKCCQAQELAVDRPADTLRTQEVPPLIPPSLHRIRSAILDVL